MGVAVAGAPHAAQDGARGVLERHVHVRDGVRGDRLQQPIVDAVRLQVQEAQPGRSGFQRRQFAEQAARPSPAGLHPPRCVLAHEHEFARARGERRARGAEYLLGLHGLVVALDERDGAEGAAAVAAVGDLHVRAHRARPARHGDGVCGARLAGRLFPGFVQSREQRRHVQATPEVDFGDLHGQLVPVALHEAAHGGDAGAAGMRGLRGVEDSTDGLLLGRIDEPAGVHYDDVRGVRGRRLVTGDPQAGGERIGVGLVLGAAERLDEEAAARDGPQR